MGACFDMRVRIAMELLQHSPLLSGGFGWPIEKAASCAARLALDTATELFSLAEQRGLIEPLGEMDEHLKGHIRRQIDFEMEVARERQRQADEAARMPRAVARAFRKDN